MKTTIRRRTIIKNRKKKKKTKKTKKKTKTKRGGQQDDMIRFPNGYYDGDMTGDKRETLFGAMFYDDGRLYDGPWVNDKKEGSGLMFYPGPTYQHGVRKSQRAGNIFDGIWENDKKISGIMRNNKREVLHEGDFHGVMEEDDPPEVAFGEWISDADCENVDEDPISLSMIPSGRGFKLDAEKYCYDAESIRNILPIRGKYLGPRTRKEFTSIDLARKRNYINKFPIPPM